MWFQTKAIPTQQWVAENFEGWKGVSIAKIFKQEFGIYKGWEVQIKIPVGREKHGYFLEQHTDVTFLCVFRSDLTYDIFPGFKYIYLNG